MKNKKYFLPSIIIGIAMFSIFYLMLQHHEIEKEADQQRKYQEASNQEARDTSNRMKEDFKNINKTR